jgi:hypothetical protein
MARSNAQKGGDVQSVLEHHDYRYRNFICSFSNQKKLEEEWRRKEYQIRGS